MAEKLSNEDPIVNEPITADQLQGYIDELAENETSSSKIKGDRAAILKRAEDAGVHKEAFKLATRLDGMDEHTRIAFMDAFGLYSGHLGLHDAKQHSLDIVPNE